MTSAVDILFKAVTEPQHGPPRASIIHNAEIYVTVDSRFRDCLFYGCTIQCAFAVKGPGNGSNAIVTIQSVEEAFSPEFLAVFANCTFERGQLDGTDTKRC